MSKHCYFYKAKFSKWYVKCYCILVFFSISFPLHSLFPLSLFLLPSLFLVFPNSRYGNLLESQWVPWNSLFVMPAWVWKIPGDFGMEICHPPENSCFDGWTLWHYIHLKPFPFPKPVFLKLHHKFSRNFPAWKSMPVSLPSKFKIGFKRTLSFSHDPLLIKEPSSESVDA